MKKAGQNIFIIYGVGGHAGENWFPWLKEKLEQSGHHVYIPNFPTPENQTLKNWLKVLEQYKQYINQETIFIGHSLGVAFILNVAELFPIKAAFLVASFIGKCNNQYDEGAKTFSQREFNWPRIKTNCPYFKIYHSDNDPYLPLEIAGRVSSGLGREITLIKGAGHFNTAAGYTKFPLLLADIKNI